MPGVVAVGAAGFVLVITSFIASSSFQLSLRGAAGDEAISM
jgi:hypothetical protein